MAVILELVLGRMEVAKDCIFDTEVLACIYTCLLYILYVGRDMTVGIATRYGLEGPGIESRWVRDFPQPSSFHYNGYRLLSRGLKRPGHGVYHPLYLASRLKKE
jgi:hypothetical protein